MVGTFRRNYLNQTMPIPITSSDCDGFFLANLFEWPPARLAPVTPAARRKALGVDTVTPVYLCVQNLRKVHHDFDALLGLLLENDPLGRVVLVVDEQPGITEQLLTRLRGVLGANSRGIGVVGRQDRVNYLRLVSSADVLLDTLHYGSGANTVADAVACGIPLVTLPGRFHRGRWPAQCFTKPD